jgi:hypothetical protein
MPGKRSTHSRSEAKFALVQEYLTLSNVTQRQFCIDHQIAYSTFQLYLSKYRRQQVEQPKPVKSTGHFLPLTLPILGATVVNLTPCELVWPDGMIIRFGERPSLEYLIALIQAWRPSL